MKTDRELLELVAKAMGYVRCEYTGMAEEGDYGFVVWDKDGKSSTLYPLTKDEHAFRLIVKLGLDIHPKGNGVEVWHFESRKSSGIVDYGNDPYAATRRAIVIVAAQIGSMK